MSEHATIEPAAAGHAAPVGDSHGAGASPEFDRQEVASFGKDDAHAITVIGKMLVLFFFYSLLAMAGVAIFTMGRFGQTPAPVHSHSAGETADF